jgi:hypothetical protein
MLTERIMDTKVETTVDNDIDGWGNKAVALVTGNTVRLEGLAVDNDERTGALLHPLRAGVVSKAGLSVSEEVE